ncbi:hypothetical protein [Poseidonibacter antarcticus]|uniref:hypothetical protein n=1 Tax=Poseidonibacter antarcticus TaxID=2478538 RepID=UPI000EF52694|nr:hypothetical protein [Poseidonibacter antarcticus]
MKKIMILSSLGLYLLASGDYVPLSQLPDNKKKEYNFVEKNKTTKEIGTENKKSIHYNNKEIIKLENNEKILKEYKSKEIIKDELKYSENSFTKDFSITPKLTYMYITTDVKGYSDKTHEIVPEVSFVYKDHTLKVDYFNVNANFDNEAKLDSKWYRLSYLYKYDNVNIGFAYNDLREKLLYLDINKKGSAKFPTLELHLKNTLNNLVLEYGGFYGKDYNKIKHAYEYYLNLGYKIFDNDNLIFNIGYKNRTIESDDDLKLEFKGPTIGISTTF